MKRFLLAICLNSFHFISFAQVPYPLVTPGAKYYTDGSEIYYLETSFNKKNGYENVYNVNTQFSLGFCLQDTIAWIGKVKKDSVNLDFNISVVNDVNVSSGKIGMLMIEPWKKKGSKTFALTLPSGNQVWSEIKDVKWETFLGVSDSVKTITFYLKQPSTMADENMYDSLFYKISRQYGIIETRILECEQFSGIIKPKPKYVGNKIRIIGISAKQLGWKPKSLYKYHDYSVGDILTFFETYNNTPDQRPNPCFQSATITVKIKDKKVTNDSLIYGFEQNNSFDTSKLNCKTHIYTFLGKFKKDSTIKINTPDKDGNNYTYNFKTRDSILYLNGCSLGMTYAKNYRYVTGKGLYSIFQPLGWGAYSLNLLNYIITSVPAQETDFQDMITLSPNPANTSIQISSSVHGDFQLLNTSGVKVLSTPLKGENIDISSIAPGMYFFKVITDQKILKSGKLIIQ